MSEPDDDEEEEPMTLPQALAMACAVFIFGGCVWLVKYAPRLAKRITRRLHARWEAHAAGHFLRLIRKGRIF